MAMTNGLHANWKWTLKNAAGETQEHRSRVTMPVSEKYIREVVIAGHVRMYTRKAIRAGAGDPQIVAVSVEPLSDDQVLSSANLQQPPAGAVSIDDAAAKLQ